MNTYFRGKCEPHKAKEGETGWEQAGFLPTGQVRIDRLRSDNVLIGPCTLWGTDNGTWYAGPVISHTLSGSRWGDNKRMAQPPWPVDPMFVAVEDEPGKVWGHEGKVNLANIDGSVSVETFWDERVMERRFLPPAIYHREH
jgi:hypothetical protein